MLRHVDVVEVVDVGGIRPALAEVEELTAVEWVEAVEQLGVVEWVEVEVDEAHDLMVCMCMAYLFTACV